MTVLLYVNQRPFHHKIKSIYIYTKKNLIAKNKNLSRIWKVSHGCIPERTLFLCVCERELTLFLVYTGGNLNLNVLRPRTVNYVGTHLIQKGWR